MKKLLLAAVAAVVVAGSFGAISVQPASAQGIYIGVNHHRHHYYRGDRYRRGYVRPRYAPRYYRGLRHACRPGWSVQDGVCKPYRGF